jgi:hypothetical protein
MKKIKISIGILTCVLLLMAEKAESQYYHDCGELCDTSSSPCPTNFPPTSVPWNSACKAYSIVTCPDSTPCLVYVCYCYRYTGTTFGYDYHIRQFWYADCHNCPTHIGYQQMWDLLYTTLLNDNPAGFPCPPYTNPLSVYWREFRAVCVKEIISTVTDNGVTYTTYMDAPCGNDAYCFTAYTIWCDGSGNKHFNKTGQYTEGDCGTYHGDCQSLNCS